MSKLLDAAIEVLLVALLTFMPLAFGAVEPWSELVALTMGALLALLVALRQVIQPRSLRAAKWALVAVVAYLVLAFAQLMTLPLGVIELVSPSTYQVKSDLLLDVPHAQDVVR